MLSRFMCSGKEMHGMSESRPYRIWRQMRVRCGDPNYSEYHLYGGKGISVCAEWISFKAFWEDMSRGYADNLYIDRKDNSKGYSKDNCRWVTPTQQARNTRSTIFITSPWGRLSLREAAERAGLPASAVYQRLYRLGWPESQLLEPLRK